MNKFKGQALSWELQDGVVEVALHREPCNEIGSLTLEELEKFVAALEKLRDQLSNAVGPPNLRKTLDWRIPLFKAKYGTQQEQLAANRQLDRFELSPDFPEPCRDILQLMRARLALDSGDPEGAQRHLEKLKDDSPERQHLQGLIADARTKAP